MDQNIIKYLEDNRNKFSQEALAAALCQAGYNKADIAESMETVFKVAVGSAQKNKREFKMLTKSKALDFCIGFFTPIAINIIFYRLFDFNIYLVSFGILIIIMVFAYKHKYRFLFYGTLAAIVIPIILSLF